jgi:hypothetical protein
MTSEHDPAGPAAIRKEAARAMRVLEEDIVNDEARTDATAEGQDETLQRLGKLEAWVEVIMRTLATVGLENLLIELDEARGADYSAYYDQADES